MPEYPLLEETEAGGWTPWERPLKNRYRECCCDCGLVHDLQFRTADNQIEFRVKRNKRATGAARRGKRYAKIRDSL